MNYYNNIRQNKGITLIALVITIIVLLILAGVSISMLSGDNGIISNAKLAKEQTAKAEELEKIRLELQSYNASVYTNEKVAVESMLSGLLEKGLIDSANGCSFEDDESAELINYIVDLDVDDRPTVLVYKGENSYRIILHENGTFSAEDAQSVVISGGELANETYVVDSSAFSSANNSTRPEDVGKFTIRGSTTVVFKSQLGADNDGNATGEQLSISIEENSNVSLYFNRDSSRGDKKTYYYLTNSGLQRSAIDIKSGSKVRMFISKDVVVTVDSGLGATAPVNTGSGSKGGSGGYAGIRVPEGSTLNLRGNGELVAIGGDAGSGGTAASANAGGGRRRRRWCWYWR